MSLPAEHGDIPEARPAGHPGAPLSNPAPAEVRQFNLRLPSNQQFGPASMTLIEQWAREGRVPVEALLVPTDGSPVQSVLAEPRLRVLLQGMLAHAPAPIAAGNEQAQSFPPTSPGPVQPVINSGGMSVMIPYNNKPALIGYYLAVAALIPGLGVLLGPVAIGLGIAGLRKRLRQPEVHGLAHAWVAIILGAICTIGNGFCIVSAVISANS